MQIQLRKVTPDYIEKENRNASQIWDQNITINKGEHLHIVAPSGSGKTSLMHFIYGLRKDYSGAVYYDDKDIKKLSVEKFSSFRQNKISIIFQDLRLFEDQTVQENIEIKRILDPYYPSQKIAEMAQRLGIETKLNQMAKTCSYGEQQRIAIIRALMQPFDWLIMDEPFSHLDKNNIEKAVALINAECKKRNAGFILTDLEDDDHFDYTRFLNL